jgi:16S rRNA processing protein RimM
MVNRRARSPGARRSKPPPPSPRARRSGLAGLDTDGLIRIGYVAGSHGLHGAIRVRTEDPDSRTIDSVKRLFFENSGIRREMRVIESSGLGVGAHRLVLEGVEDSGAADAMRGSAVLVSASDLPTLKEGEFYYFQLAQAEVMLTDGTRLGIIEDIISAGANDIWVVRAGEREIMVPVISEVVKKIDLEARRVTIEPVPGLLE